STVINYTYDPLYRLTTTTYPSGTINYAYDAVGNRLAMTDTIGVSTYHYDDLDRLLQVTGPNGKLNYSYDANSNRTNLTYPNGKVVTSTYDLANRLLTVSDWNGRVTTYSYDAANRQTGILYPNNIQATYTYDNADQMLNILHTSPVSGSIAVFTYTLDAVGNRLSMTDLDGATSYTYDDLYRLTQVTYPDNETVIYAYDPIGNRTVMTSTISGVITYTYDADDRLLTAGSTTFTWDANGNMTDKGNAIFTFDGLDRLTQVVSGTTTVQFTYDGDGVRLRKVVNGTVTTYTQDIVVPLPMVLVETITGQTNRYIYGNDLLAQIDPANILAFYHNDGLGSTRVLSNLAGQRTDTYNYNAFGAARSFTGNIGQPFTFAGEQTDDELGLIFLRARYFDPQIGRFISSDFFPGFSMDTQSINSYIYTQNNPVNYADPNGEFIITALAIGVIAYAGYETYQAWDDLLYNSFDEDVGLQSKLALHYSGDFENPEWQQNEETLPQDIHTTLGSASYAAVTPPGTSITGPPPTSLSWTGPVGFILNQLLPGFKKPTPNRIQRRSYYPQYSNYNGFGYYTGGSYGSNGGGSWGGPPSGGK
ncbi:MAG: RHS repeat-associated core domain-containing protein, partial [Chloroflexi bacterium]|nr:RHS repeat-associated core domain-containing protein [Chloroflexota bacterium]